MKNRTFRIVAILVMTMCLVCFAACKKNFTEEDAKEMIAGFTTNPTMVSGAWEQDFKLEVQSENQSFKSFEQDLKATVTFELDLTAGNLYYYAKRVTDAGESHEEIVVKNEGKYYYKSTTLNAVELADEAAALAKIGTAFKAITTEKSGWLDLNAFLYNDSWVSNYVMLGSTNVPTTSKSYFAYTYSKTDAEGLHVDLDAKYVGYTGDSGIVDVGTSANQTGSKVTLETDSKGNILSLNQNVNNYIEFNITNPPIPLVYTGTRKLTATYSAVTPKTLDSVSMTATFGTVGITKDAGAQKVELYDFNGQAPTASKSTVQAGNYIAIKVTCAAGKEVDAVTVNGSATQNINGFYCLMAPVVAGNYYEVNVTTKDSAQAPTTTKGTVTVQAAEGITYELYDYEYNNQGGVATPTTGEVEQGHFIAVKITSEGEVTVKVDGNDTTFIGGFYCYMSSVVASQSYEVVITSAASTPEQTGPATVVVQSVEHATCQVYDFNQAPVLSENNTVEAGHYIAIKVTCEAGWAVDNVTVNGNATQNMNGYYCLMTPVTAGAEYTVVVTLKAAE